MIYVDVDKETVRATDKVDVAISLIGSDISFSAADNSINSVATDLSVFSSGQQLIITGSALNDVAFTIAPTGPAANKILVLESVTTEAAGANVNVLADVQFYNCTRGALNTRAVAHEINTSDAPDRRTKVTENIYIEMPLVKMLLAMLTGNVEGQAQPFPSNWTLGIDTKWVATASFLGIGADLWDTSNDVLGFTAHFQKLSKRDGKKFIEEQLLRLGGCFMRVRNDGQLELRRFGRVAPDSAYVAVLNDNNVAKGGWGNLKQDFEQIHNVFTFHWNPDSTTGKPNRHQTLFDPDSVLVHGATSPMEFSFEGLTGYTHTQATLAGLRDSARDMHAGGPLLMTVKGMPHLNVLECGDIVRCQTSAVRDPITGGDLDRSFIILGTRKNWMTGEVVLVLFGSSQAAAPIADAANAILPDGFYEAGTDITTVTTGAYVGPVWHITADSTLVGHADANNLSAIYSFNGSVTLDPGVTLYIDDNVQLRIKEWTRNGTVDGVGRGLPGAVAVPPVSTSNRFTLASPGAIGVTESGGSVNYRHRSGGGFRADSWRGGVVEGSWTSLPVFDIRWDGANLVGLPSDLRGTPGSSGGGTFMEGVPGVAGGNGGNGPAALIIVAQNIYEGAAGSYNLSGGDGAEGSDHVVNGSRTMRAGAGAGGAPSGLLAVIDGPGFAFITLTADQGLSPTVGTVLDAGYVPHAPYGTTTSHYVGMPVGSRADANLRIQHLRDDSIAPEPDPPSETGRALSINVQVQQATKNGLNIIGLELSVDPPTDTNYRASRLYIKLQGTDSWTLVGDAAGNEEKVVWVPADAATYNIKAHPIAINGNVSDAYIEDSYTVQATAGIVVIGSGNQVQTSDTVGEVTNGQGLIIGGNAIVGYSPTGAEKTRIDASTGKITAVDVNLTGSITALAGSIGGWLITSAKLSVGSGVAHLELNPTSGIWMGADLIASAPFSVTPAGVLTSKSGSIGGWNIAAAKLSIGSGVAHLELNPASGIWMGADLIADAPFSVTPAGALTSKSGSIGGWNIAAAKLSIGSGVAHLELNPASGIWMGADLIADAPFSVTPAGALTSKSGSIGGWSIVADKLSIGSGVAHLELNPASGIWMGADLIANAPFSVTPAGALTSKSGSIGGWNIAAAKLSIGSGVAHLELNPASGIWMGADLIADAPFSVTPAGALTSKSGSIGGWSIVADKLSIGSGVAHLELNPASGIWMGADLIANAPFSVTPAGALTSKSGSIGGWNIAAAKLSIGSGVAHLELNPASGIWMGADLIANAPFSVTPAGALTSKSGSIGGWTLSATNLSSSGLIITSGAAPSIRAGQTGFNGGTGFFLGYDAAKWKFSVGVSGGNRLTWDGTTLAVTGTIYATAGTIGGWDITAGKLSTGLGVAHLELNPTTGIWMGADLIANAPFSVTPAGALTTKAGTIGGWSIGASTIKSANNRVILDAGNQRIQLQNAAGTTYVRSDAEGILGVHATLGTVFKLPTDGSIPLFASGIINSTIFNITSSGILRTSSTVGDGSANGQGILANDTGLYGYKANSATPVFRLSSTDGKITALDALLTGGGITLSAGGAIKSTGKVVGAGAGFFLGYDGGAYQFDVGDHDAKKSIHFNGTDLVVGENTKLLGASAYDNDSVYIHELMRSPSNYITGTALDGSVTSVPSTSIQILTMATLDSEAWCSLEQQLMLASNGFLWTVNRKFKTKVRFYQNAMDSGRHWSVTTGSTLGTHTLGFIVQDGVLMGEANRGATQTRTSAIATLLINTDYLLEVEYIAATYTANFYVDGVLGGTITGWGLMPSVSSAEIFRIHGKTVTAGSSWAAMRVGELKVLYGQ
ncbi:MAG: hypothetical protein RRB22_01090 [Gammaproteobacteria bacterium]|nr:hypothetical protein [Gammaproteobacteria bacterium]